MKKLLVLLLMLLPAQVFAWEQTLGLGYDHRRFGHDDQLGAVSQHVSLRLTALSGLKLSGSWLWNLNNDISAGPEVSIGHGWLSAPHQSSYVTKTAGEINTSKLNVQSVILSGKLQVLSWREHLLFLKPGFLISNLSHKWDSVDTDTGATFAVEFASKLGEKNRVSVDVQAILSPTVRGKNEYDLALGVVLGIHRLFKNKPDIEVPQPVKPVQNTEPEIKVVPSPPSQSAEPAALPTDLTPVSATSVSVKRKATLKLNPDGKLNSESYPLLQNVIDVYKSKPSVVKIRHVKNASTSQLVKEIKSWMISNGVPASDITLEPVEILNKPIKIEVQDK